MSDDGLVTIASRHSVQETIDRLEAAVKAAGITIFARIDHGAGAAAVEMPLRPTQLLIFGNAKGGTPLMQSRQTIGLDLPLKMLAWEDAAGKVWLTYSDIGWLARRHGLGAEAEPAVAALGKALAGFAARAAG
jgi:uncharacterized protein (DUF302 family)